MTKLKILTLFGTAFVLATPAFAEPRALACQYTVTTKCTDCDRSRKFLYDFIFKFDAGVFAHWRSDRFTDNECGGVGSSCTNHKTMILIHLEKRLLEGAPRWEKTDFMIYKKDGAMTYHRVTTFDARGQVIWSNGEGFCNEISAPSGAF